MAGRTSYVLVARGVVDREVLVVDERLAKCLRDFRRTRRSGCQLLQRISEILLNALDEESHVWILIGSTGKALCDIKYRDRYGYAKPVNTGRGIRVTNTISPLIPFTSSLIPIAVIPIASPMVPITSSVIPIASPVVPTASSTLG